MPPAPPDRPIVLAHDAIDDTAGADARDVLAQLAAVRGALARQGHACEVLPITLDLAAAEAALRARPPLLVFNLVESLAGDGRLIHVAPALFEHLGLRYTGAGPAAMLLSSHKILAKQLLRAHGLPTPDWLDAHGSGAAGAAGTRWIVKSLWEDASLGLDDRSVCEAGALAAVLQARRRAHGGAWFAERFVAGREFNIALLEDAGGVQVLPAAEILFEDYPPDKPRIVGYAAKWDADSFEYRHTPRSFAADRQEPALAAALRELARRCWDLFGLRGYARVDFRVDERGQPWIIELNANPCLSPDAGFAAALAQAGIPFDAAVAGILQAAA